MHAMMEPFRVRKGTAYYTSRDLIIYAFGIGCYESPRSSPRPSSILGRDQQDQHQHQHQPSEMSYLYEHDNQFSAFPTFPLTLNFRARGRGSVSSPSSLLAFDLPDFPPPMMKGPDADLTRLGIPFQSMIGGPVIHLSEKYHLHRKIPITNTNSNSNTNTGAEEQKPIRVELRTRIVSILPKKRATIVITETNYHLAGEGVGDSDGNSDKTSNDGGSDGIDDHDDVKLGPLLATSQSTTLYPIVMETSQKIIQPPSPNSSSYAQATASTPSSPPSSIFSSSQGKNLKINRKKRYSTRPSAKKSFVIPNHQALMYRLSGDTNAIHVVGSPAMFQSTRPILHGLCTLGYAVRAVQCSYIERHGGEVNNNNNNNNRGDDNVGVGVGVGDSTMEQVGKVVECHHVECQFTKPLFVGDEIEVRMWWDNDDHARDQDGSGISGDVDDDNDVKRRNAVPVLFQVRRVKDDVIVVDGGYAEIHVDGRKGGISSTTTSRSSQAAIPSKL